MFHFSGDIEISKSWYNRALIIQSFVDNNFDIAGESSADDVVELKKALQDFRNGVSSFKLGLGGTTFRFFALRLSRTPGQYTIQVHPDLFKRPQSELLSILEQLGVDSEIKNDCFYIHSRGWKNLNKKIVVSTKNSSQFLSSLILNTIDLDFDLKISYDENMSSGSYFKYTLDILKKCRIHFELDHQEITIFKRQIPKINNIAGEVDVSSAFSICSAAVLSGEVNITNWNTDSKQPDMLFLDIFIKMNIPVSNLDKNLKIIYTEKFNAIEINLKNAPDLFPVLAVLCSFASGTSRLYGAAQLVLKESNRIQKTAELLRISGFKAEILSDGLVVHGEPQRIHLLKNILFFDPENDHRMAMAASLLILKGFPLQLKNPYCITKSYPQFYKHIGLNI